MSIYHRAGACCVFKMNDKRVTSQNLTNDSVITIANEMQIFSSGLGHHNLLQLVYTTLVVLSCKLLL